MVMEEGMKRKLRRYLENISWDLKKEWEMQLLC
jgi:hypothetical protein